MLEETGIPYAVHPVDIIRGAQFNPDYLALNPNNKVPTIVDEDGPGGKPFTVFETGAILVYLAEKTGQFMPSDRRSRFEVTQWLMWQMGGLGPMLGQAQHFHRYATEKVPYAIERYTKEGRRLLSVMERQLDERDYLAGDYSIADIACFPWVRIHKMANQSLDDLPRSLALVCGHPCPPRGRARPQVAVGSNGLTSRRARKRVQIRRQPPVPIERERIIPKRLIWPQPSFSTSTTAARSLSSSRKKLTC